MIIINIGITICIYFLYIIIIFIIIIFSAPTRYSENFLPRRTKLMMSEMGKNGKDIFKNKGWGASHW